LCDSVFFGVFDPLALERVTDGVKTFFVSMEALDEDLYYYYYFIIIIMFVLISDDDDLYFTKKKTKKKRKKRRTKKKRVLKPTPTCNLYSRGFHHLYERNACKRNGVRLHYTRNFTTAQNYFFYLFFYKNVLKGIVPPPKS